MLSGTCKSHSLYRRTQIVRWEIKSSEQGSFIIHWKYILPAIHPPLVEDHSKFTLHLPIPSSTLHHQLSCFVNTLTNPSFSPRAGTRLTHYHHTSSYSNFSYSTTSHTLTSLRPTGVILSRVVGRVSTFSDSRLQFGRSHELEMISTQLWTRGWTSLYSLTAYVLTI